MRSERTALGAGVLLLALVAASAACSTTSGGVAASNPDPTDNRRTASTTTPTPGHPVALPTRFVTDRFYLEPMTADGLQVLFFTDTGGGLAISRDAAKRLGLTVSTVEADGQPTEVVLMPAFAWDAWIPKLDVFDGRIPVVDTSEVKRFDPDADGVLGQAWFKDRVWTFDYGRRQLLLRADGDLPKHEPNHRAYLGFAKNAEGKRSANYPRIEATIDGDKIDLLRETGATIKLTPAALGKLGDGGPAVRGTSFIVAAIFAKWTQKHPEWRVIESADASADGEPMIEVPSVSVGGHAVGPVWFTRRPDKVFHEGMAQSVDKPVDGGLGGSALRFFTLTVDYPRGLAVFEQATPDTD